MNKKEALILRDSSEEPSAKVAKLESSAKTLMSLIMATKGQLTRAQAALIEIEKAKECVMKECEILALGRALLAKDTEIASLKGQLTAVDWLVQLRFV